MAFAERSGRSFNVSLLSVQLHYRRSFSGDSARNSADNIPQEGRNCADNPSFRSSPSEKYLSDNKMVVTNAYGILERKEQFFVGGKARNRGCVLPKYTPEVA
jgi:hypothetical protein